MDIYIYNYLYKKKKKINFNYKQYIKIYICGPTTYKTLHLGNLRTLIFFDILRRYLLNVGYKVIYVTNITDIGIIRNYKNNILLKDKINITKYLYNYHYNLFKLNILCPTIEVMTSNSLDEQIKIINKILKKKKYIYKCNNSIYINLKIYNKYYKYGILKNIDKKYINKFCIWKKYKNNIIYYNSKWGKGYSGWHTSCVSIINKYLGNKIHIHGGGIDLKFPHHENEIVHFNILYKKIFSYFFIYVNSLLLNNKKMSKKNNNFISIKKLKNIINISYDNIRFFLLQNNYKKSFNFTLNKLKESIIIYKKIKRLYYIILKFKLNKKRNNKFNIIKWIKKCYYLLNNDLQIPLLIKEFLKLRILFINKINLNKYSLLLLKYYFKYFLNNILGLLIINKKKKYINILLKIYKKEKKKKNWKISDKIKNILLKNNII